MQAVLKLQNSSPQDAVDTKTSHQLQKQLDIFMEKKSIKDTTTGWEIPEPPPAASGKAVMLPTLPSGALFPKSSICCWPGGGGDTKGAGPSVSFALCY